MPRSRIVPTRNGVQYTLEQWAEKRQIITQMYSHEGKSLREVKEFLRIHHDFRPTDRMYQRKIEQWDLPKKHKGPEMQAILGIFQEKGPDAQQSIFRIRGRQIDIDEVYKYFRRRGEDPHRLDFRGAPIPSSIEVETPRPLNSVQSGRGDDPFELSINLMPTWNQGYHSPPETEYDSFNLSSDSSSRSASIISTPLVFSEGYGSMQLIPNYPIMGLPIDMTLDNQFSRVLLHWTQIYFDAVVRQEFWPSTPAPGMKPWRHTFSSWARVLDEGHELMQSGQTKASWALRGRALESVPKHIRNPSPLILFRYFEIVHAISGEQGFLLATLRHVLNIADAIQPNGRPILPPGHPIRELTRLLLQPAALPIIAALANQGIRKCLDILNARLGPTHPRLLYVLESRTQTYLDERAFVLAAAEARRFLDRAEMIRGPESFEACQARRMLGDSYVGQGSLQKAREAYEAAFSRHRTLKGRERGIISVRSKRGLAGIARLLGERDPAEAHLVEAEALAILSFGKDDVHVMLIRRDLEVLRAEMQAIRDNELLLQREVEQIYSRQAPDDYAGLSGLGDVTAPFHPVPPPEHTLPGNDFPLWSSLAPSDVNTPSGFSLPVSNRTARPNSPPDVKLPVYHDIAPPVNASSDFGLQMGTGMALPIDGLAGTPPTNGIGPGAAAISAFRMKTPLCQDLEDDAEEEFGVVNTSAAGWYRHQKRK